MRYPWHAIGQYKNSDEPDEKTVARLNTAYRDIFSGEGSKAQAEIVLSHLAQITGYFSVQKPDEPSRMLRVHNAKRSVFLQILRFVDLNPEDIVALQEAVRNEGNKPL